MGLCWPMTKVLWDYVSPSRAGCPKKRMRLFRLQLEASCLQWSLFYLQLTILACLFTVGAFLLTALASLLAVGAFLLTVGSASNKGLKGL